MLNRILILLFVFIGFLSENIFAQNTQKATFGMGCFWCTEAIFQRLKGVSNVRSGYEGGKIKNPTYEQVSSGLTGHAEVIELNFDPKIISYQTLLEVFWKGHDPTTLNKQGADVGTQYRSIIFYHNNDQKILAEKYKATLNKNNTYGKRVVTIIESAKPFYIAESYHQNYYNDNVSNNYCRVVILPKLEKIEREFKNLLKKN